MINVLGPRISEVAGVDVFHVAGTLSGKYSLGFCLYFVKLIGNVDGPFNTAYLHQAQAAAIENLYLHAAKDFIFQRKFCF